MQTYDAIVVGTGGIGSAALDHLARRGLRVLGLDRHPPGHAFGSSHGQTRIIRQAYYEHPDYVPLTFAAYDGWADAESRSGENLLVQTGLLQVGPASGRVLAGVIESADRHALELDRLTASEITDRWPVFRTYGDVIGLYETKAGFLHVERCVLAHCCLAENAGATLITGEPVRHIVFGERTTTVQTDRNTYEASRLIIAAGSWTPTLLPLLAPHLRVLRKQLHWYATDNTTFDVTSGFPGFLLETPTGIFYGFPKLDDRGVKVAEHSGGETVDDPSTLDRAENPEDRKKVDDFVEACLPDLSGSAREFAVCMYTMTPDEHFVLDFHPAHPHVLIAAGFSGHGFKFAPVIGQALADLAIDGSTDLPVGFLSATRPALSS